MPDRFFLIVFLFFSSLYSVKGQDLPNDIKKLFSTECDEKDVLVTILRAKKLEKTFPKNVFSIYYDFEKHNLKSIDKETRIQFIKKINEYYNSCKNKGYVIRIIKGWCDENKFLNSLSASPEVPPEAVLHNFSATKSLVKKYLKEDRKMQSWYSLSSVQLFELNIDFSNFYDSLSNSGKKELNKGLKRTAIYLESKHKN